MRGAGVDVRLGPVGRSENNIIAGVEQCQRGDCRLVEILTDRCGTSATQTELCRVAERTGTFHRTIPILSVMMTYAEKLGLRPRGSNPCRGTPRYKRKRMERFLSAREYGQLGAAQIDLDVQNPLVVAAIRLLIYTGEILRALMNKAEEWGIKAEGSNPCRAIRMNRCRQCERFLSDQEFQRLGEALNKRRNSHPLHCAALYLLMLTGCRKSEITGLLWSEVKGRRLRLTDSKTGPRTIWLGEATWTILQCLPRHKDHPEVFWNPTIQRFSGILGPADLW